jgi:hypothetical protein
MSKQRQQYEHPEDRNPFKFIEQALTEAKGKIEKMKQTPVILEQLPDVSRPLNNSYSRTTRRRSI